MPSSPTWEDTVDTPSWDSTSETSQPSLSDVFNPGNDLAAQPFYSEFGNPTLNVQPWMANRESEPGLLTLASTPGVNIPRVSGADTETKNRILRNLKYGGSLGLPGQLAATLAPETTAKVASGLINTGAGAAESFTSPLGAVTAPLMFAGGLPGKVGAGLFSLLMAPGTGENLGKASVTKDPQDITEAVAGTALNLAPVLHVGSIGENIPLTTGERMRNLGVQFENQPLPPIEPLAIQGGEPISRPGVSISTEQFNPFTRPDIQDIAGRALKEAQGTVLPAGQEPALLRLRREISGPDIQPAGFSPKEDFAGGQVSFASPAEAGAIPSARQSALPFFDRTSEELGLGRESTAPTLEQIRASRALEQKGNQNAISQGQEPQGGQPEYQQTQPRGVSPEAINRNRPEPGGNELRQQGQTQEEIAKELGLKSEGPLMGRWMFSVMDKSGEPITFAVKKGTSNADIAARAKEITASFEGSPLVGKVEGTTTAESVLKAKPGSTSPLDISRMDPAELDKLTNSKDPVTGAKYSLQREGIQWGSEQPKDSMELVQHLAKDARGTFMKFMAEKKWDAPEAKAAQQRAQFYESALEGIRAANDLPGVRATYDALVKQGVIKQKSAPFVPEPEPQVEGVQALEPASGSPLSATDSLINRLESLKLAQTGQGRLYSLPHPDAIAAIGKGVWNSAIDTAIAAIKAGKSIANAVNEAISYVKKNAKDFDEEKLRKNLQYIASNEGRKATPPPVPKVVSRGNAKTVPNAGEVTAQEPQGAITKFAQKDVIPVVSKVLQGTKQAAADIKATLTPPNVDALAQKTAGNMRENLADLARKTEIGNKEMKRALSEMGKLDNATNLEFMRRLELGEKQITQGFQSISDALRKSSDQRLKSVRDLGTGKLENAIENYLGHIWTPESVARLRGIEANPENMWARIFGRRPLEGQKSFLKRRTFPTIEDGIKAGLVPVTYNPVELVLLKNREIDKYVSGQKIFQEMKDNGTAQLVPFDERPPAGWTRINDKIAQAGSAGMYYAPDAAARVINNYLSPGLRGNVIYDAVRGAGNVLNQVQLGLSAYHATFTAIDSATSALSLGLKQLAESKGDPAKLVSGLASAGKSIIPLYAPIENFVKSSPFLKEYYKPGSVGGQTAQIVDTFQKAGGRVKMDTFYHNSSVGNFWNALKEGNYPGAVLRAPFALLHLFSKPIMEVMVPRMKIGIFTDMAKYELEKMTPEQRLDQNYVRKTLGAAWDSVDNRMGQMVYDNLFWNRTLKDLALASVRSVGWNLGTLRELGGGLSDVTLGTAKTLVQGRDIGAGKTTHVPEFTHRTAYLAALPILVGLYGAMYQYLRTGKGPQDLKDYYVPRTGNKNPDGTEERVMLPTYLKDVAPLAVATSHSGIGGGTKRFTEMVQNKANPLISMVSQMLRNKDFYGTQIRNQDDPLVQQAMDEAKFVVANFQPFSVRNTKQRQGTNLETRAEGIAGIMPASKELMRTKAQEMMYEIMASKAEEGGTTKEVAARKQTLKDIAKSSTSPAEAKQKVIDLMNAGGLSPTQAKNAIRNQTIPTDVRMFKSLYVDEAMRVYNAANEQEKAIFKPLLSQKLGNAFKRGDWPIGKPIPVLNESVEQSLKKVGQQFTMGGQTWRVVKFDNDGHPLVEQVR